MRAIKAIYVVGDSFSFGQELGGSDVDPGNFYICTDYMRDNSYTGIIAKKWNIEAVFNKSLPGGSNDRIFRMITTDLPTYFGVFKPEEIFVFISLTNASRREFCASVDSRWYPLMPSYSPNRYDISYSELWKTYSTYFDTPKEYTLRFISQVLSMQAFLGNLDINYLMSDSMNHGAEFWDEYKKIDTNVLNIINSNRYYRDEPFNLYATRRGLPFGKHQHPLEEGHIVWAENLMQHINTKYLNE